MGFILSVTRVSLCSAELIRCFICLFTIVHLHGFYRVFIRGNVIIRLYVLNRCMGLFWRLNGMIVISTYPNKNSSNPICKGSLLFIIFIFCRFRLFAEFGHVFIWFIL